jgi:hypothetical protein
MDADGGEQTLLTRGSSATWSPGSKDIAFHASTSGTGRRSGPTRARQAPTATSSRRTRTTFSRGRGAQEHHEQSLGNLRRRGLVAGWAADRVHEPRCRGPIPGLSETVQGTLQRRSQLAIDGMAIGDQRLVDRSIRPGNAAWTATLVPTVACPGLRVIHRAGGPLAVDPERMIHASPIQGRSTGSTRMGRGRRSA